MKVLESDLVVVGAGLLGSSCAMSLARLGARDVTVVDLDLEGVFSSSELNAGGVRATWNHPVNAAVSKLSIDYYSGIGEEIGFRQNGYFWMYSREQWPAASSGLRSNPWLAGLGIEYLAPAEVTARYPFLDKTSDLGGATFSPRDGLLNANLLKGHYRAEAARMGVRFLDRIWVHHVSFEGAAARRRVELKAWKWPERLEHEELKRILTEKDTSSADEVLFKASRLVNCSGAWARRFAGCMGAECRSAPLRRQVSVFDCKGVDLAPYGMFVDPSGVYFHAEAGHILGGYATPEEPTGYNFEYEGAEFFEKYIWPPLYERSTRFEQLKHLTGWAGLYEVSPDKSGILGPVAGFPNVFEAHSFSGRGAMQSYGAGLGLAELIRYGKFQCIDLTELSGSRFEHGNVIAEGMLI